MPGRQAKLISQHMLRRMLAHVRRSNHPERDAVIILLSVRAGLRACEIARLEWSMVLDARGRVGRELAVEDRIAKKRSGRRIPLHTDLVDGLSALRKLGPGTGPIVRSARGGAMRPNSIVNWFVTLFRELDLSGCSSHSGRRSFITATARALPRTGGSLRDVQLLAGHRSIETTQGYIDGDTNTQRRLIALI
jgi:integrase